MKKRITQLLLASILLLLPTLAVYAGNDEGHLLTLTYDKAMCEVSVEGFQRVYQSGDRISDGAYVLLLVKPLDGYVMDEATYNGTPIPVSYTHLRAHETSLHLVCRLLLEKKKKKM